MKIRPLQAKLLRADRQTLRS